jgi:uncharacterized membrane protein
MSNWIFKSLMAVAVVGGALVTAGVLPAALGGVAVAVGVAGGYFHEAPSQSPK